MSGEFEPYQPRWLQPLPAWPMLPHFKPYTITLQTVAATGAGERAMLVFARQMHASLASGSGLHASGFGILHEAASFNTIAIAFWINQNELVQQTYRAPAGTADYCEITATGQIGCVWELAIQAFERDAWVAEVLQRSGGPSLDHYSSARLSGWL